MGEIVQIEVNKAIDTIPGVDDAAVVTEGLKLIASYRAIQDAAVRRQLVSLAQTLAKHRKT
jgi:hypothetical protein